MSKMISPVTFPENWLTLTGLKLPDDLPYQDWEGIGELLSQARRRKELELQALLWAIGDWLAFGEAHYGEKYAQAVIEFGRSSQTLMNLCWVASKFSADRRHVKNLSIAHHSAVAALPPPDADALLDMAEIDNASSADLRRIVQDRKVRDRGLDPDVERAKDALDTAMLALTSIMRRQRAPMIIEHLIKPLADVAGLEREQFLSAMLKGCCEVE